MKKSEAFYLAQIAVLHERNLSFRDTLEILRVLMSEEDVAKLIEKRQAEKEEQENGESV